jgi:hypothetical protein
VHEVLDISMIVDLCSSCPRSLSYLLKSLKYLLLKIWRVSGTLKCSQRFPLSLLVGSESSEANSLKVLLAAGNVTIILSFVACASQLSIFCSLGGFKALQTHHAQVTQHNRN